MGESGTPQQIRDRYGVPDGVHLRADASEVLAYLPAFEQAVRGIAAHPDALTASGVGGRAPLARIQSTEGPLLVRAYRKGGLLRHVRGSLFHGRWRPLEELVLHRRLRASAVPVLDAVGCVVLRSPLGWRGFLVTREVKDALDLEAWLYGVPPPVDLPTARVLRRAGRAVRQLHDAGVAHPDLHPKNLLLAPTGEVLVIDLDRARGTGAPLGESQRLSNLVRLGRALEKHRLKGLRTGRRHALRFLEGYAGDRAAAAQWLERVQAALRRWLGLRILWWRLIGEARPWPGQRGPHQRVEPPDDAGPARGAPVGEGGS